MTDNDGPRLFDARAQGFRVLLGEILLEKAGRGHIDHFFIEVKAIDARENAQPRHA